MSRYGRRRRQRKIYFGSFYLNPSFQYLTTIVSAILLSGLVFSGFLLFRFTDEEDLISRGKMQLREGKVAYAEKTFQTLVSNHPSSYEGHLLLGKTYLELNERRKAEQEFQIAASLKNRTQGDSSAEIALSKVAMVQGDFQRAEEMLLKTWKRTKRQDKDVKQALFELYEQWGNHLMEANKKDYGAIIEKYEFALHYVKDYEAEQAIEDKLIEAIQIHSDQMITQKNYEQAIKNLKLSLRMKYLPETLKQIADNYVRMGRYDDAIDWYRKAYEVSPDSVGLPYTQALVQQAQKLVAEKKTEEAQKYFDEADRVSKQAELPMHRLYPVKVASVKIAYDLDEDTGEFEPSVQVQFVNDAPRTLNFLVAKAEFISGNETLSETTEVIANPDNPLPLKGDKKSNRAITFKPHSRLNVHALTSSKFTVKISIAYQDGEGQEWEVKTIQEALLRHGGDSNGATKPV